MSVKQRRYIDAKTGDYVVESGGFKGDVGWTSKAVLALRTKLGSSAVNPGLGSRLHLVSSADDAGARQARGIAEQALAHLEIPGLVVTAEAERHRVTGRFTGVIKILVEGQGGSTTFALQVS